ncbi:A/G-specific adenine glycosylase [bacterium]|nr:MAG: A/G-specific adenine glycosylase [bacterium]RKZ16508.1 MAG: A/G-specific adenine glycosylase [bacterium]
MSTGVNQDRIGPRVARALAADLLDWYREQARDLPWRHSRDPYAIWVSEVMLQQTRVEVVTGRWQAFLDRFPDIESLAAADDSDVLAQWAGLGYYRRAKFLHRAATELADRGLRDLPRSAAELRLLPGFGAYTAGAVASIAFGERVTAVDGNVERVFARLLALPSDPSRGESRRIVGDSAAALLGRADPKDLNQALMELGATVCTPRSPRCDLCPWTARCRAHSRDAQADYPRRPARKAAVDVVSFVAIARDSAGRMLFRRRPDGGHNARLWELPSTALLPHEVAGEPSAELAVLAGELGRKWLVHGPLVSVRHSITHHRIRAVAHAVEDRAPGAAEDLAWLAPQEARERGLTAATAKLLAALPTLI